MIFKSKHFKISLKIQKGVMDVTPLVIFQLIIFFLVSSNFVLRPGIQLSSASILSGFEKSPELSVSILRDGRIFFNEKQIDLKELGQILKFEKIAKSQEVLIIKADQKTYHGTVVKIMGIAKQAGIAHIAIAAKPGFIEKD